MGFRGMVLAPLLSLLLGYALNRFPPEIITESRFYREDRFGLRSALQHAHEHIVSSIEAVVSRAAPLRDAVLQKFTGKVSQPAPPGPKLDSGGSYKKKPKKGKDGGVGRGTVTRLFTAEELAEHSGADPSKPVYIALLGHVFDVSKGRQHYGPGGGYAFFAGRDASRAFVSGDFSEAGLRDDVDGLSGQDYIGLEEWLEFYRRDYREVGLLVGRYFGEDGRGTEHQRRLLQRIGEAHQQRRRADTDKQLFPPCNSEWSEARGGRVSCSRRSGGVSRDWVGVPRQYFTGGGGKKRCACVRDRGPPSHGPDEGADRGDLDHPQLEEYPGCPPRADSCAIRG
ncbi:neuferricin-like [Amphibalanus amphitrite]|uniref:neuferricin-like n=1 Tax=Amphibalanus amphitrite TaxID=1232801 RepID=UPI001C8FF24C|nr:neuferricin-like [Amphibalanus amphitrite]